MTREEVEFSISQHLDGTLPLVEQAALQTHLLDNAEARALLDEYRELQAVLKQPVNAPIVQWDALAAHLSSAVAASSVASEPVLQITPDLSDSDALDLLLTAYLDGTLSSEDLAALEDRLAVDANTAARLVQYRQLDAALHAIPSSFPLPEIRWAALAGHLSDVVANAGAKPVFSFKWARSAGRMAIAACVLLAAGIGISAYRNASTGGHHPGDVAQLTSHPQPVIPASVAMIVGPQLETATGKAVVEIEIGGPAVAVATPGTDDAVASVSVEAATPSQFADVILSRPSRVVIANGDNTAQDSSQMPY